MQNGDVLAGLIKSESHDSLTSRTTDGQTEVIAKREIKGRRSDGHSMMPEDLPAVLPLGEFTDLVSYLETLRGR